MWFSCFPVLPGSAEAQVIWRGIVKRLLIAYFIGNVSAKKYQNPFMCVKVIASQRWDILLRHSVDDKWRCTSSVSLLEVISHATMTGKAWWSSVRCFACRRHLIHEWSESPTCSYSPAAQHHCIFASTHLPPTEGRRLSWPDWLFTRVVTHLSTSRAWRGITLLRHRYH